MIGDVSGMICDGAKPGLLFKIINRGRNLIKSAMLSSMGGEYTEKDGMSK